LSKIKTFKIKTTMIQILMRMK